MSIFDDADAMYAPVQSSINSSKWGVKNKATGDWAESPRYDKAGAERRAMRMNDDNSAAEDATW